MVIATKRKQKLTYVFEEDRKLKPEQQTKVFLTPLTLNDEEELLDGITIGKDGQPVVSSQVQRVNRFCRDHVQGWENLADQDGKQVDCVKNGTGLDDDSLGVFSFNQRSELFMFLFEQAGLKAEEDVEK